MTYTVPSWCCKSILMSGCKQMLKSDLNSFQVFLQCCSTWSRNLSKALRSCWWRRQQVQFQDNRALWGRLCMWWTDSAYLLTWVQFRRNLAGPCWYTALQTSAASYTCRGAWRHPGVKNCSCSPRWETDWWSWTGRGATGCGVTPVDS